MSDTHLHRIRSQLKASAVTRLLLDHHHLGDSFIVSVSELKSVLQSFLYALFGRSSGNRSRLKR